MSDTPENQGAETEKGFGTGLRAQLQRRREGEDGTPVEAQGSTNVELRFELTARPASGETLEAVVGPDVQALRAELEAAQAREATLRDQLQERSHTYEQNVGSEKELAHRALTLDEREAKLAEFEVELEERERRVRDQREAIEAEHTRVADLSGRAGRRAGPGRRAPGGRGEAAARPAGRRPPAREGFDRADQGARGARRPREEGCAQGERGRHARAGRDGQARRP